MTEMNFEEVIDYLVAHYDPILLANIILSQSTSENPIMLDGEVFHREGDNWILYKNDLVTLPRLLEISISQYNIDNAVKSSSTLNPLSLALSVKFGGCWVVVGNNVYNEEEKRMFSISRITKTFLTRFDNGFSISPTKALLLDWRNER